MEDYIRILQEIRSKNPLVLQITNSVTENDCANMTICFGAAPVMSADRDDAMELAAVADALVLNIGTLTDSQVEIMRSCASVAQNKGIPVVLDPVGAGASAKRSQTAYEFMSKFGVSVVKGNAGEILALAGDNGKVRGVDSISQNATESAVKLAKEHQCVVVVSGENDIVTDGKRIVSVANGIPMMGKISGTGCMSAPCCAAACSVTNPLDACVFAMTLLGIAGEIAGTRSNGPGTFKPAFFDAVYAMDEALFRENARISEVFL